MFNENKVYWKEILLILIGGLLASVPILISTKMQTRAQLHQYILDKKITAIKDYSTSFHRIATEVYMCAEIFESNINDYEHEYIAGRIEEDKIRESLKTDLHSLMLELRKWESEVNSQIIVINAIFNENFPQMQLYTFDEIEDSTSQSENLPFDQRLKEIKVRLKRIKNNRIKIVNNNQTIINELKNKIERN